MSDENNTNEHELLRRAYYRYLLMLRNICVVLLILVVLAYVVGLPHIQTTYTYYGQKPKGSAPATEQKVTAWYFSITGWQHVRSGQYGNHGCPIILLIPLEDCID